MNARILFNLTCGFLLLSLWVAGSVFGGSDFVGSPQPFINLGRGVNLSKGAHNARCYTVVDTGSLKKGACPHPDSDVPGINAHQATTIDPNPPYPNEISCTYLEFGDLTKADHQINSAYSFWWTNTNNYWSGKYGLSLLCTSAGVCMNPNICELYYDGQRVQ